MSEPRPQQTKSSVRVYWIGGIAAILEILLITGVSLIALAVVESSNPLHLGGLLGFTNGSTPDYWNAALGVFGRLAVQYGSLCLLVFMVAVFRRRTSLNSYALAPQSPVRSQIAYGFLLGVVLSILPSIISLLQEFSPIGTDAGWWHLVRTSEWGVDFWIYASITCFIVIPALSEFLWRGYVLGRLREVLPDGTAILLTALLAAPTFFVFLRPDAAQFLMFVSILIAHIAAGCTVVRQNSLLPVMIAHGVMAFPLPAELQLLRLAAGLAGLTVYWPQIRAEVALWSGMFSLPALRAGGYFTAGLLAIAYMAAPSPAVGSLIGLVIAALAILTLPLHKRPQSVQG